jgi:hypothetical protein
MPKPTHTAAEIEAEIARRIANLRGEAAMAKPLRVLAADLGRYYSNWRVEFPEGYPEAAREAVLALMREWDVS